MHFVEIVAQAAPNFVIIFVLIFVFIVFCLLVFFAMMFARPWLQAFISGHPISMISIIGMRLRRISPSRIIPHGIAAAHAGYPIKWAELESACIQGVDMEKVVTAYLTAGKRDQNSVLKNSLMPNANPGWRDC